MSEDVVENVIRNYTRYFIYSETQMKIKRDVERRLGKNLVLGTVIVNGESKPYTEIVTDLANVKYSDAEIVTHGDIRKINYTVPV